MVKSKRTTESTKRFTFQSFRDRVENIKIEPSKDLKTRAFDEVDDSHFLSSLDRWVEFNRSGSFTQFVLDVRVMAQSLPQIIFYKEKIFDLLAEAILKQDPLSLQPLLELLTQLCHDLGPDFMVFYERSIKMITQLALTEKDSNAIEWEFNALAFIFKYLSKTLSKDLLPTFELLEPLLKAKAHIARFCSEALSFLIRKTGSKQLLIFTNFAFDKIGSDIQYQKSIVILFSESLKSTKGSIHSKSTIILETLLERIGTDESSSVLADILIDIISYGNQENVNGIYKLVLEKVQTQLKSDSNFLGHYLKILIALVFADSGRKVNDWVALLDAVKLAIEQSTNDTKCKYYFIYFFTLLLRNCEVQSFTKVYNALFQFALTLDEKFLPFILSITDVSKEKSLKFGQSFVQTFINRKWESNLEAISLFVQDLQEKDLLASGSDDSMRFRVILPKNLTEKIYSDLEELEISQSRDLYQVYWRLLLLSSSTSINSAALLGLFQRIQDCEDSSKFKKTVLSKIISLLVNTKQAIDQLIVENFELLCTEIEFLRSATKFVKSFKEFHDRSHYIKIVSNNLTAPDHETRLESLYLINALANGFDEDIVTISNQAAILEEIPLDVSHDRDISIRMRSFAGIIKNLDTSNDLKSEVFFKFIFGLLSVGFLPMWRAVEEILPTVAHKNIQVIWNLAYAMINGEIQDDKTHYTAFFNEEIGENSPEWLMIDERLRSTLDSIARTVKVYSNKENSILSKAEARFASKEYPEFIRTNVLKVLKTTASVAEKNSTAFVSLILDDNENAENSQIRFTKKEQVLIYEVISSFKKLQSIPQAQELRQKLLCVISGKAPETRKVALKALLGYHNQKINKYKDNLNNLLDDALFRDELAKIFAQGGDSVIEDSDLDEVMPVILRILFGRAQTVTSSGNKKGLRLSAITILVSMESKYVEQFLNIVSEKVVDDDEIMDFEDITADSVTSAQLKRSLGFVNLSTDIIKVLGEKFVDVLPRMIKPLLLSLVQAQIVIDSDQSNDERLIGIAKSVRQTGAKDLLLLFQLLRDFDWDDYIEIIYEKVFSPRFPLFEFENLQQPSSMLSILVCWSENKPYHELLMINDFEPAVKVLTLLSNPNAKDSVISTVFDFARNVVMMSSKGKISQLQSLVAESVFSSLNEVFDRISDQVIVTKAIDLLLALVEKKHVKDQGRRIKLVDLATKLLEKPANQISRPSKLQVLQTLKALIEDFDGEFDGIKHLYEVSSKFLKLFSDRQQRAELVKVIVSIGEKFEEFAKVASLVEEMNAFSRRSMDEFDYDRRLAAYREVNDKLYKSLTMLEWLPLLNNALFFINEEDLSIRTNAGYTLKRYVDAFSSRETGTDEFIHHFKTLFLTSLRFGLRSKVDAVQAEYVSVLYHIVANAKHVDSFEDMRVLLEFDDAEGEEDNFFTAINHIQLYRRQRAVRQLSLKCQHIKGSNIAHYILPIVENYAYCTNEKFRNLSNDAISVIESLVARVSYKQYVAVFKRYLGGIKEGSETQRDSVQLMLAVSQALLNNVQGSAEIRMEGLPTDNELLDIQIERDMIDPITKVLNLRNEETVVQRTPLIQAMASLVLCLSHQRIVSVLPGVLTKICQTLRSRFDDLREATRKYLGRAAKILGAKYIKFIIKELKTALARGFQVHVLGYTVNSILLATDLKHGDLDESASLIMEIVMENMFGSTGQDKEAEGYRTTMKEVKTNKSFDTAEILSKLITLSNFGAIVAPIKLLLQERITFRVQNKLDELLRRISLGVVKNEQLATQDMLVLCYQLFQESEKEVAYKKKAKRKEVTTSAIDEHFLVQLDSKPLRVQNENNSVVIETFQKLSLDLLRTTLSKNLDFVTGEKLSGFLPCFKAALESENEAVLITVLRVLTLVVKVQFESKEDIFESCAQRCLSVIKDYPSTESELVQACFRFLSIIIRHREDLSLSESALGYLLIRIQPDMNDQNRQGMAFNFLKAVVAKHVMIPEVYDTMDKVREVMVTSHSKERRDTSRSIYFQFIMEYDQGRGRLEKQFKFLVDNLSYPAEEGKQSVMELIHLIIGKSGAQLLEALASSFFVGLARVLISETEPKTREMAVALITLIFEKTGVERYEKYIIGWLNSKNSALLKCALQLYRIKLKVVGIDADNLKPVDDDVLLNIKDILDKARADSEIEVSWELIYSALNCLSIIADKSHGLIDDELKEQIISTLLFPHSWIRLASSRLVGLLVAKEEMLDDADIQNIANRLLHQLRAPKIEESLGSQAAKFLTFAFMKWAKEGTVFDESLVVQDEQEAEPEDEKEEPEEVEREKTQTLMVNWAIKKIGNTIRSERVSHTGKKAGVQFFAMTLQILGADQIQELAEEYILPLFALNESDSDDEQDAELQGLSAECLKMIETKIGVSEYTQAYSTVRTFVLKRRQERRTARARLALNAPDIAAKRKVKKHIRGREKRKNLKDANGFYHAKKKRRI